MIKEIITQTVDPARRDAYVQAFRNAWHEANMEGWRGGQILTCIEDPARVVVVIEWDTVEDHTRHRGTPPHTRFREAVSAYQTAPSQGAHYLVEEL
jgi:heme-degrading monooxygenase HmoA